MTQEMRCILLLCQNMKTKLEVDHHSIFLSRVMMVLLIRNVLKSIWSGYWIIFWPIFSRLVWQQVTDTSKNEDETWKSIMKAFFWRDQRQLWFIDITRNLSIELTWQCILCITVNAFYILTMFQVIWWFFWTIKRPKEVTESLEGSSQ